MKTLLLSLVLAAALPDADPAVWVVRDDDTTIYLFGTFHLLDGKSDWFNDEVKAAFEASQEVVLEAVPPENPLELQSMVMKYAMDANGRTLSSRVPPALMTKLDAQLTAMGVPLAMLEPMDPWFVTNMLAVRSLQKLGLTGEHGAEAVISTAAAQAGIPLRALEGFEFQIRLFDAMPEKLQVEMLRMSIEELEEIDDVLKPMLAAWSRGDVETFAGIFNDELAQGKAMEKILRQQAA